MATLFSYFTKAKERTFSDSAVKPGHPVDNENEEIIGSKRKRCILESDESSSDEGDKPGGSGGGFEVNMMQKTVGKDVAGSKKMCLETESFLHIKLRWLQRNHLRDKNGIGISHPDYDPKTIWVPQEYLKKLTPGFQQWWAVKSDHFDSVIMFKVGKFYELYHMDAVVGVQELGLVFMKSEFAHCGFPEAGFDRYSNTLVQKGYRVVRVEQVETSAMMEQRIKKTNSRVTKSDRVVRREVCSVITKGTRTLNFFHGNSCGDDSTFLVAVKEQPIDEFLHNRVYGVCFVDTCVGTFHLGQFKDDIESSNLRMLFAHYPPGHVLYEKRSTNHLINLLLPTVVKDALTPGEFWSAAKTLQELVQGDYFERDDSSGIQWPLVLKAMLVGNAADLDVAPEFELAFCALGACMWCLKRAHLDYNLLSLAHFESYDHSCEKSSHKLILDDIALYNLGIIARDNQSGTLLNRLDTTVTAFGRRLLRQWVCTPLASVTAIETRQDAVEQLLNNPSLMAQAKDILRKLPDLERLIRKVHTEGSCAHHKNHPDSRAVFFEQVLYNKRKIADFLSVLDGLRISLKVTEILNPILESKKSTLLCNLLDKRFPDIEEQLVFYEKSFDRAKAKEEGHIIPNCGVDPKYDTCQEEVECVLRELEEYLIEQKQRLNCKDIKYWGSGRNRFQLEVPISAISSVKIDDDYELTSQRKGVRRYRTPALNTMLVKLACAEEIRDECLRDTMKTLFCSFDQHFTLWEEAIQCLAILDVLISLASYSLSDEMTRPIVVTSASPLLEIDGGRHPCITRTSDGGAYVPNDVVIKGQCTCLLVTGPNMGGKSTLMRQTGLLIVLAQLGCYIPATKCIFSPVDRIFTRMGASDRIMAKQSTFLVELRETSTFLRHATCRSLVLVDELGRGTATYDGAAIACAVLEKLAKDLRCRTLFSTHYHFLVDHFKANSSVQLGHMACMVGEDEEKEEVITFLYKFTMGACPKSYGFNVAKIAGLPSAVISSARKKAAQCEEKARRVQMLRKFLAPGLDLSKLKT